MATEHSVVAIVPAAGVGSRMKADRPKQYLAIGKKTILEHTVDKLLSHPRVSKVVIAVSDQDPYYEKLSLNECKDVIRVSGGNERADSVLSALNYVTENQLTEWVMVHDAARPCVRHSDLDKLIQQATAHQVGGIMASPVRDTMKRSGKGQNIEHTVERTSLWHALTPQMFRSEQLKSALENALNSGAVITDEASAIEWAGFQPLLVQGRADNIKITQPEDLELATFYLNRD
ncbi:2-C-methyl-D-erythritol 4-phosphate cytidylyltransferase [Vibrio marisflavi]|uniref:2-C-methyl-D-erythritol 4-phosphate cytidylyltransferase n=1 Tax=Vibrio marisflavi CECT 7928 TaxID=634439 RepID=A0ABN8E3N3_9VIBR|nr:2-C-methyl-D-erythritol 4-phosphate cytidylyltransferase [Vibrio marisflavi]CAH0538581.1 2-C-methyl-D-erythritol 4-phosphate cytidylyltransferase [Vibrio marisflavi CECT 7928]